MSIEYRESCAGLAPDQLTGFFVGWAASPDPQTHLRLLAGSDHVVLAFDPGSRRVVGFATAVTDGVLTAYIPLVEVLPDWQDRGIGAELTRRLLDRLKDFYAVDLLCDPALQPFYERFGMRPAGGMMLRRYALQSGRGATGRAESAPPSLLRRLWKLLRFGK
jgi:ribosomal protein S18 acetylase RimI-like enzyme